MTVVVFDIDGTLTVSSRVDDESFARTARQVLGLERISLDWSTYPHSTDDAIAHALVRQARGRAAQPGEVEAFRLAFVQVLDEEIARAGGVRPVPGAARVFDLVRSQGWLPAIATGCWRASAVRKLNAAGLGLPEVGAAFADDAWPRAEIVALAAERARALAGAPVAPRGGAAVDVVYVGDGVWDVRACAQGGYRYVGLAEGPRAEALRQEGAGTVLADYADECAFLEAIRSARAPQGS